MLTKVLEYTIYRIKKFNLGEVWIEKLIKSYTKRIKSNISEDTHFYIIHQSIK